MEPFTYQEDLELCLLVERKGQTLGQKLELKFFEALLIEGESPTGRSAAGLCLYFFFLFHVKTYCGLSLLELMNRYNKVLKDKYARSLERSLHVGDEMSWGWLRKLHHILKKDLVEEYKFSK